MNELYSVDGQMYSVSPENKEKFLNEFPGAQLFQERSGVEVDMTEPDQVIMEQTEFATDMLDPEDMSVDEARAYLDNKGISVFGTPDQQLERKYRDQLVSKEGRQELFGVDLNRNLGQRIQNAEYLATLEKEKRGFIVGVSSVAGDRGRKANYIYGSAKAGFSAYLSGLRNRLYESGVHVLTVKPGFVNTKMTEGLDLPPKLTAQPEDVAKDIYRAQQKGKDVLYTKGIWRLVMLIIKYIPEFMFKKMSI